MRIGSTTILIRSTSALSLGVLAVLLWSLSCSKGTEHVSEVRVDLPEIIERGTLRAITTFSSTSYFIYRGRTMGFEYELLDRLAGRLGLDLEIIVADDIDRLLEMLRNGEGDIVAHNLAVTADRKELVAFTTPHMTTRQVLVQRRPEEWRGMKRHEIDRQLLRNPIDLIGKTVHVRRGSSYYQRLVHLSEEIGGTIDIELVDGRIATENLIRMVAEGKIDYTVADENLAYITQTDFPILDVETSISLPQRIAWAVRKSSPRLREAVNDWIEETRKTPDYYTIYNKYFRNRQAFQRRSTSEYFAVTGSKISPYDSLLQTFARSIGWDWRLLAALVYQESRFDPEAQSWAGACGLMQMMPATAAMFGVSSEEVFDPAANISAGAEYLAYLGKVFADVPDSLERVKFILAAYNTGENHVLDARRLAERYGEDSNLWTGNVEEYMLLKADPEYYRDEIVRHGYARGSEPVQFVREILDRYAHYQRLVPASPGRS